MNRVNDGAITKTANTEGKYTTGTEVRRWYFFHFVPK